MAVSIAIIYIIIIIIASLKVRKNKSERVRQLLKFIILNGVLFLLGMFLLIFVLPLSMLNLLTWIVYDLIISYVIAIEVPGYLKISNFDNKIVLTLQDCRKSLIKMRYSFDSIEILKTTVNNNTKTLSEEKVGDLLNDFINFSERIKNIDNNLLGLTLNEVSNSINRISQRSKHPIPKLIDILSLSGISFLIAQILKILA